MHNQTLTDPVVRVGTGIPGARAGVYAHLMHTARWYWRFASAPAAASTC